MDSELTNAAEEDGRETELADERALPLLPLAIPERDESLTSVEVEC